MSGTGLNPPAACRTGRFLETRAARAEAEPARSSWGNRRAGRPPAGLASWCYCVREGRGLLMVDKEGVSTTLSKVQTRFTLVDEGQLPGFLGQPEIQAGSELIWEPCKWLRMWEK